MSPSDAFRDALPRLAQFTALHFAIRLVAAAILVPLMGGLMTLPIAKRMFAAASARCGASATSVGIVVNARR